ncbi:MAG: hydrogenase maturation nickel metallochaperone HypA [Anaerolineae bacterium]|nr:hydrogenase maturation nickel metallochaperone HypA [Anaerolineae bacterium]
MHEAAITEQLLELTLRHAEEAGAIKVTRLNLVIGEFSSVVGESVEFYFEIMAKGGIAEGAELHFERVPGLLTCLACEKQFPMHDYDGQCPFCGEIRAQIADGDQFRLDSIEVEGPESDGKDG